MSLTSKKATLVILGITALACSRAMFMFFSDPEGPNLLIVVGTAAIIYALSLMAQTFVTSASASKRLFVAIATQILIVICLYCLVK
jgi:hypothetical protein